MPEKYKLCGKLSSRSVTRRHRAPRALLLIAAATAARTASANTPYAYTGPGGTAAAPTTGNFSTGFGGSAPVSSTTTELDFADSPTSTGYTATNDTGTFTLNALNLSSLSPVTDVIAGSPLNFNGTSPTITQYNAGAFNISAGLILSTTTTINGTGSGPITLSGPITGSGPLVFNNAAGSLNITGANTLTGNINVGSGTVNFTGSTSLVPASGTTSGLDVGNFAGTTGVVNINTTGTLDFYQTLNLGELGASGAVNQTAGNVASITNGGNYVMVGNGGYGSYVLSGGNLSAGSTTNLQGIRVGGQSGVTTTANGIPDIGVFTQTGGNLSSYRYLVLGGGAGTGTSAAIGVGTFTGGTQFVTPAYRVLLGDGANSTGYLNLGTEAGGTAVFTAGASSSGGVLLRDSTSSLAATLNLNAGTLILPGVLGIAASTAGNTVVNLNGGVIQSGATTTTVISSAIALPVVVYNGGAAFNVTSNAYVSTVSANLSGATGNGVYVPGGTIAVPAVNGGSGYIGSPVVVVSGGGVSGTNVATAVANVSNGVITGVTLTSPGQGYTLGSTISFTFTGGGTTTVAPTFNYSFGATADPDLAANGTGGLTKTGPGMLVLTGTNTYTGVTFIQGGVLEPASTAAAPGLYYPGAINVSSGGTLDLPIGGSGQFSTGSIAAILQLEYFAAGSSLGIDTTGATTAAAGTLAYPITGVEGLTKFGSNTLYLTTTSSYTGITNVSAGTLNFIQGGLGTGPVLINGGTLQYATGTTTPDDLTTGRTLTIGSAGGYLDVGGNNVVYAGGINGGTGGLTITSNTGSGSLTLGGSFNPTNTLSITGGVTVNLNSASASISASSNAQIWVGQITNGTLNVSGGASVTTTNFLAVGRNGATGVLNLGPGGLVSDTALAGSGVFATIGSVGTTGTGTINQTGGIFDATTTFLAIGETATGYYNISGGSTAIGPVIIGKNTGATGTLNLNGGTFTATSIAGGGATGTVYFNSGTLQANGSASSNFLSNVNTVVTAGGAIIDTNGQNITVSTALQSIGGIDGGLTKVGVGNLTLAGNSNFNGGTNVSAGTVTAATASALGSGTVTLNGGTLSLSAPKVIGFNGFTLTTGNTAVAGPSVDNSGQVLTLSTNLAQQANAGFTPAMVNAANGFIASFTYTPSNSKSADGIAFVVENDPRGASAVGGAGGALGVGNGSAGTATDAPIANSLDIELNIYGSQTVGSRITTNGTVTTPFPAVTPVALGSGDPINVVVSYNASTTTVTETLTDSLTGVSFSTSATVNLATVLNGNTGYVGFTGGTGGLTATQQVSSFSFNNGTVMPVSITNPVVAAGGLGSTINVGVSNGSTSAAVGAITVNPGATLTLATTSTLSAPRVVLSTPSVAFNTGTGSAYTGKLDIGRNDLDITSSNLSTVTGYVAGGFNYAGGANWSGPGITSSAAAGDTSHLTAVGVISNNGNGASQLYGSGTPLGLFDGSNPGANDVLVKYTYFGDANLDGKVDGSDYSLIDAGYAGNGSLTGWYNGDFNYDGVIDGSDYALIDNAFNNQGGAQVVSTSALVASSTDQVAGVSAVPEPASIGLMAVAAAGLIGRRRKA